MLFVPYSNAVKAKLCPTETFHVITTHILLNCLFACWAFPCVLLNPFLIYFLLVYEFLPLLYLLASRWLMRLPLAFKTINHATWALYVFMLDQNRFFTKIRAAV